MCEPQRITRLRGYAPSCSVSLSRSLSSLSSSSFCERNRSLKLAAPFPPSSSASSLLPESNTLVALVDPSLGAGLARSDRDFGVEKLCAPPAAYAVNALVENAPPVRTEVGWREGERLRARLLPPNAGGGGDLGRFATLANGDEVEEKASKPVRFWGRGVSGEAFEALFLFSEPDANAEANELEVDANGLPGGGDWDLLNIRGPETDENGELLDA